LSLSITILAKQINSKGKKEIVMACQQNEFVGENAKIKPASAQRNLLSIYFLQSK